MPFPNRLSADSVEPIITNTNLIALSHAKKILCSFSDSHNFDNQFRKYIRIFNLFILNICISILTNNIHQPPTALCIHRDRDIKK